MKTKIEFNFSKLGKLSAFVGLLAAINLFLTWDMHNFALSFISCILILMASVGLMAWACWKIEKIEKEHKERYHGRMR